MNKFESILNFSIVLNRGYCEDIVCDHFSTVNHPQLITQFVSYVNNHKPQVGLTKIENRQGINDSGCDVFVELFGTIKIGVQIKSQTDVLSDDFSNKVKAQYAESYALGLDKYYILICCPLNSKTVNKVNYIVNHFAGYQTNYHVVLNPSNCVKIFLPSTTVISDGDFRMQKQLFSEFDNRTELSKIMDLVRREITGQPNSSSSIEVAMRKVEQRPKFTPIENINSFASYLSLSGGEIEDMRKEINRYFNIVHSLSGELREFYSLLVEEAEYEIANDGLNVSLTEVVKILGVDKREVFENVKILCKQKYGLAKYDEDEPSELRVDFYSDYDTNIPYDLKSFCTEKGLSLKEMLVNFNFQGIA